MPRSPRMVEPDGVYHLTSRGNDGRAIFMATSDRVRFLALLELVVREQRWILHAYCLMDNHVHLLVQAPDGDVSAGMQRLLGSYSRWWNRAYGHYGHVFVNRFRDRPVESQSHLLEAARYIDLNPVRAGMSFRPEQWPWSSYRAHVGLDHPRPFLANARFLELFGPTPDTAREAYRQFVREGHVPVSDTGLSAPPLSRG